MPHTRLNLVSQEKMLVSMEQGPILKLFRMVFEEGLGPLASKYTFSLLLHSRPLMCTFSRNLMHIFATAQKTFHPLDRLG